MYITLKSPGTDLTPPSFPMCSGINNAAIKVATFNLQHTVESQGAEQAIAHWELWKEILLKQSGNECFKTFD